MLRSLFLYTALLCGANAAFAGQIDFDAAHAAGLAKLAPTDATPAPQASFTGADGQPVTLADYKGKALLVNFWATWCAPCRAEMPSLDRLQQQRGGDDFQVLTIATGRNAPAAIDKFLAETGIRSLPRLTDPKMALARAFGVLGMPVTVLIDADGQQVARLIGDAEWDSPAALAVIDQLTAN